MKSILNWYVGFGNDLPRVYFFTIFGILHAPANTGEHGQQLVQ